ncbi:hypothetical protein K435DRAFT_802516 [Dendrothele bispora CBS 962.96]|uniref:No apical meristem-associated C-terminal domain-containing protein n=1 Tax=Dendrothele bispora (strain CBS 962.96) TaxID=1314807 RepID=A0A4V4HE56_DENBC|nr:hypothetical protein K435DRAFT_802516 [Dendrothele bispora CBS 962.96]
MMGETSAGLTSEEQIDMSRENSLTTAWNRQSQEDLPILLYPNWCCWRTSQCDTLAASSEEEDSAGMGTEDDEEDELLSDGDTKKREVNNEGKRKYSDTVTKDSDHTRQQHGPKKNKSKKAEKPAPGKKGNMFDKFAEVSKEEEKSRQKRIQLQQMKVTMEQELAKEKIQVAGTTKVDKERIQADYRLWKMMPEAQDIRPSHHPSQLEASYLPVFNPTAEFGDMNDDGNLFGEQQ